MNVERTKFWGVLRTAVLLLGPVGQSACTEETMELAAKRDASVPEPAKPDAAKPDAAKPDAAKPDAAKPQTAKPDAAVLATCPATEPQVGSACAGTVRCRLQRHGDCSSPVCPAGCTFKGFSDGVQSSGGITYFAVCSDGVWTTASEGACHNPNSSVCACTDQTDAGA